MRGSLESNPAVDEAEFPRHEVRILRPFAMAVTAVTLADFAAFAAATGHTPENGCHTLTADGWRLDIEANWRTRLSAGPVAPRRLRLLARRHDLCGLDV